MSRFTKRFFLAGLGGGICGLCIPSLVGERWLFAWSILIVFSLVQGVILNRVLPDEVER